MVRAGGRRGLQRSGVRSGIAIHKAGQFRPDRLPHPHGLAGFGDPHNGQHSWTLDEEHSCEIIHRGLELGVSFFDAAVDYQSSNSEQYLGRALRDFAKREDVVVAAKFLPRTREEIAAGITAGSTSRT